MSERTIEFNEVQTAFIKEWYPDVDADHLLLPALGLSSVTSLDLLDSTLKYDIEHQNLDRFPNPLVALNMLIDIKRRIDAYKNEIDFSAI
ncbi:MAG: hypothetical protein II153_03675 [Erysipelotrichaceae bacterium]|jgi:hypothetical protein|nr:hypothetical protein [Erysipelotrichaceae bacterium]MBQ5444843.1 hypothetical protein [Erysipelotrichaceae bacterium]MBQ6216753.1 hypothetical protein [Erysipelotrichaceae bacterium]MBR6233377.1 hypothetical protein [Erysipelotrichaceae bacterium]